MTTDKASILARLRQIERECLEIASKVPTEELEIAFRDVARQAKRMAAGAVEKEKR